MKTAFEQKAHDIQYKKKSRPSYPHRIETYTENNTDLLTTGITVVGTAIIGLLFAILIMAITVN